MSLSSNRLKDLLGYNREIVFGEFKARDSEGNEFQCRAYLIGKVSDLFIYVDLKLEKGNLPELPYTLSEDSAIVSDFNKFIRSIGFAGFPIGRADLGLQEDEYLVFEPYDDFIPFAEKYGWLHGTR